MMKGTYRRPKLTAESECPFGRQAHHDALFVRMNSKFYRDSAILRITELSTNHIYDPRLTRMKYPISKTSPWRSQRLFKPLSAAISGDTPGLGSSHHLPRSEYH